MLTVSTLRGLILVFVILASQELVTIVLVSISSRFHDNTGIDMLIFA